MTSHAEPAARFQRWPLPPLLQLILEVQPPYLSTQQSLESSRWYELSQVLQTLLFVGTPEDPSVPPMSETDAHECLYMLDGCNVQIEELGLDATVAQTLRDQILCALAHRCLHPSVLLRWLLRLLEQEQISVGWPRGEGPRLTSGPRLTAREERGSTNAIQRPYLTWHRVVLEQNYFSRMGQSLRTPSAVTHLFMERLVCISDEDLAAWSRQAVLAAIKLLRLHYAYTIRSVSSTAQSRFELFAGLGRSQWRRLVQATQHDGPFEESQELSFGEIAMATTYWSMQGECLDDESNAPPSDVIGGGGSPAQVVPTTRTMASELSSELKGAQDGHEWDSGPLEQKMETMSAQYTAVPTPPLRIHCVIAGAITPGTDKTDRETLKRYEALRSPMVRPNLPTLSALEEMVQTLHREFPWATGAIDHLGEQLKLRRSFGALQLGWTPLLLVGRPGSGKTRLARRWAELLGVPWRELNLGAANDSRSLTGTARGWGSGQPSPLLEMLLANQSPTGLVILDELDKTRPSFTTPSPFDSLLGLLEKENATRYWDLFLQTQCDLSQLLWVATANGLEGLPPPLMSRMDVVLVPQPRGEQLLSVVPTMLCELEQEWGLPAGALPSIDMSDALGRIDNVREMRTQVMQRLKALSPRVTNG